MSEVSGGRMDVGPATTPPRDLGDITTGAAQAVAATFADPEAVRALVREAVADAKQAYVAKVAKDALAQALKGDFGAALDEQIELEVHDALDAPEPDAGMPLLYENVVDWMNGFLLEHYRRPLERGGMRWCSEIWDHTEAVTRLETTWRAWEFMRHQGPTGSAVWWRDYLDPMMRELTSEAGPFHSCNARTHEHVVLAQWPLTQPPDGLYNGPGHPAT